MKRTDGQAFLWASWKGVLSYAGAAAAILAAWLRGDPLRGAWSRLGLAAVLPGAVLVYQMWVVAADPAARGWFAQAVTPSPHPLHYLLAFLPLMVLAVPAAADAWRERDRRLILLLWAALVLPLLYLPLNPQRRLVAGLHLPLSALAAQGAVAYWTGTFLPARAGVRVYLGHWAETARFEEKREAVAAFFGADTDDEWRVDLLAEHGIRYLFHGPREEALRGFDPEGASYLAPAYRNELVTIYQVVAG